jgi:hypothetical protein
MSKHFLCFITFIYSQQTEHINQSAFHTEDIDFSKSFTAELKLKYSGDYTDDMLSDLLGRKFLLLYIFLKCDEIYCSFLVLEKGYTVPKIAKLLGLQQWKIKYNMRKAGLTSRQFSEITNSHLDCIVRDIIRMFPNSGKQHSVLWLVTIFKSFI